ncbi:M56 family metallopeptidase [Parabacteroides sp. OttesenSCG-928-J18]|nr:M56 family metallopeptidase [Parabacteroides sp. OttesenSCG-928-J18]
MAAFLIYIVKSTLGLVLFYFSYKLLLSNETFFPFNRKILIGGLIACLLLPLVKMKTDSPGFIQQTFIELEKVISQEETITTKQLILPAEIPQISEAKETTGKIPYGLIFTCIYTIGGAVAFTLFLRSFIHLLLLIRSGRKTGVNDYIIVVIDQPLPPFNWWKYIVLPQQDYEQHAEEILTHELAHYHKRHSWDVVFAQIIILFHWFNPAAWLLKRELQDIHEYQADREVIKNGIDATKYQLLLVKKAVGSSSYTLANSFNQSKLKKRITMMCKKQSNHRARWKSLLLIPVAVCTLYAFARPEVNRQLEQLIPGEGTIISQDNKKYTPEYFEAEYVRFEKEVLKGQDPREATHLSYLLVNARDMILYKNQLIDIVQLESKLKTTLLEEHADGKPILISLQHDVASTESFIRLIYQNIQTAFEKTEALLAEKGRKAYVKNESPKNYGLTLNENDLFNEGKEFEPVIVYVANEFGRAPTPITVNEKTTFGDFRKELEKKEIKEEEEDLRIILQVPKDTPKDVLNDIYLIVGKTYNTQRLSIGQAEKITIQESNNPSI